MVVLIVIAVVVLLVILCAVVAYNRFVQQRQYVDNAWANVETELRRRYDLVPNLVQTVKGYAAHERATFEAVTAARASAVADDGTPAEQSQSEGVLVGALRSLLAVSEAYPDLKASTSFLDLQRQLIGTEDRIQAARRFYNNNVRAYNERVQSVPTNVIAKLFGFHERTYFNVEEAVHAVGAPAVGFEADDD
jgi:LemA protein